MLLYFIDYVFMRGAPAIPSRGARATTQHDGARGGAFEL